MRSSPTSVLDLATPSTPASPMPQIASAFSRATLSSDHGRSSAVTLGVAALAILLSSCTHRPEVSSITVGGIQPTHGTVLPSVDSLLPASARHDSAAIVALAFDTKGRTMIQTQVAVVRDGSPVPYASPHEWTIIGPSRPFVKRVAPGRYRITARQIGYHVAHTVIDLHAGTIDTLLIRMHAEPRRLE